MRNSNIRRDSMIDEIIEMVRSADDRTLEAFYWFLIMEMEE